MPIIGLATSEQLNLIKHVYKVTESSIEESFSSNTISNEVPFALKDRLKKEINHMEDIGIIEKVESQLIV